MIKLLDCTLRDGGYCNSWRFGQQNIPKIIHGLSDAHVEIIECGFLTEKVSPNADVTKYATVDDWLAVLPADQSDSRYVVMINYGEFDPQHLPACPDGTALGIRLAFHKCDYREAIALCAAIKAKGYEVYVQPMVSMNYSEEEYLDLIRLANELAPVAFYIVDSFGMMKRSDVLRYYRLLETALDASIAIGFHSHNNIQLAYSNAQSLAELSGRNLIIDSSLYGMGRGAGNLNTELFVDYLNDSQGKNYEIRPLLSIIDEVIAEFYQQKYWGYSLPNYLSAIHNIHPNYASFLEEKHTLTVEAMDEIFCMMDPERGVEYNREYIEELYNRFMSGREADRVAYEELKAHVSGRRVLLVAPGKTSETCREAITAVAMQDDVVTISVNHCYGGCRPDYIFISNLRRFRELPKECYDYTIATSNIPSALLAMRVSYRQLLAPVSEVAENAGMMAISLMEQLGASSIMLAGFDGYSHDYRDNYGKEELTFVSLQSSYDRMNRGCRKALEIYRSRIEISFVTESRLQ